MQRMAGNHGGSVEQQGLMRGRSRRGPRVKSRVVGWRRAQGKAGLLGLHDT